MIMMDLENYGFKITYRGSKIDGSKTFPRKAGTIDKGKHAAEEENNNENNQSSYIT